jgi:hypothetical protein
VSGDDDRDVTPEILAMEQRRKRVASLYLRRWTQTRIAHHLGVSQTTISRDMDVIRDEWRANRTMNYERRLDQEIAEVDGVMERALKGWLRSLTDAETVTTTETEGKPQEVKTSRKGQSGNPAYLDKILACVELRLRLIGIKKDPTLLEQVLELVPGLAERLALGGLLPAPTVAPVPPPEPPPPPPPNGNGHAPGPNGHNGNGHPPPNGTH